ncbi:enoyl-CoA hydratase [Rhizorhabdus wittichii]
MTRVEKEQGMSETSQTAQQEAGVEAPVLYEVRDGVAVVTLNRPAVSNAQNDYLVYELDRAFHRAANDDAVVSILLCGAGKHFSAGHDLGTAGKFDGLDTIERKTLWYDSTDKPGAERLYAREQEIYLGLCRRWQEMPKPVVCAVQGACIAGGLMLAWVCDIIVASDDAFFQDNVVGFGIPGVEYFAHPYEMPTRIAREFLMLGDRMPAQRAYEVGMVNRVVPREQLFDAAFEIARKLATKPRFALALTKQALNIVEDLRGKRTANDTVYAMHHLTHAHNFAVHGTSIIRPDFLDKKK